jgi:hypothetical protein
MNAWVEFLIEVKEMRDHQKEYFKKKEKLAMAKSKLSEMKVDQLIGKLEETCRKKEIELTNPKSYEPTE